MPPKRPAAVVFVHGLAKKPSPEKLREIWLDGLKRGNPHPDVFAPPNRGIDLLTENVPPRFTYYADVFYGEDYETEFDSYYESAVGEGQAIQAEGLHELEPGLQLPKAVTPREAAFLRDFEAKLQAAAVLEPLPPATVAAPGEPPPAAPAAPGSSDYEIAGWLPAAAKQAIIKKAAMEAYYFLFDKEYTRADGKQFPVRRELRARLVADLQAASQQAEKIVLVSHSMGTMIAYDVLRNCPDCPQVETLITVGSPLGISEVQDELVALDLKKVDFPAARLNQWINIYDPLDPVCGADPKLANDFMPVDGKRIIDVKESNWGNWRHTITHYFAGTLFRQHLNQCLALV
jgi:hypothetical protein